VETYASVLVVDDEEYICAIIENTLTERDGYRVRTCSDPAEAIRIIESQQIDLVLTDMLMGDFTGVDILNACRENQPDAVVIFMTGHPTIQNAISVLTSGAYDYLVKPFKLESLKASVDRGIEKLCLQRENIRLKNAVSLYQLSAAMGSTIHLDSLLKLVLDAVTAEFDAVMATITLVSSDSGKLKVQAFQGNWDTIRRVPLLVGQGDVVDRVVKSGKTELLEGLPIEAEENGQVKSIPSTGVCVPLFAKGSVIGLLSLVRQANLRSLSTGDIQSMSIIASKAASAIESSMLYDELEDAYLSTIRALANSIEARDLYTHGHAERVTQISEAIARELNWNEEDIRWLRIGGTLHDVGKIGVPDSILNKPGPLTEGEFEIMRGHPIMGAKLIEGIPFLRPVIPYVLSHHEFWDGSGYPYGLQGENIPIEGRLLAIADTVDAILTNRPYRDASSSARVIDELKKYRGLQFDPFLADMFINLVESGRIDLTAIYGDPESNQELNKRWGRTSASPRTIHAESI
jgi:response regulator RpfG family c-di-GMP phosphodiesterase